MLLSSIYLINLFIIIIINGQDISCEPKEIWSWTPWFNFHKPSIKGEYELHTAIRTRHPNIVCAQPHAVSAVNQAGVHMNDTLDMILLRSYDIFCLNSYDPRYQKKLCDDYSVRYCCPIIYTPPIRSVITAVVLTMTTTTTTTTTTKTTTTTTTTPFNPIRDLFIGDRPHTNFIATNQSQFVQPKCGLTSRSNPLPSNTRTGFFMNFFNSMLSRIINGAETRPNGWPWLVSIGIRYRSANGLWQNRTHICGGTLIEHSHVLTAAHCLEQKIDDRFVPFTTTNPTLESFFFLRIGIHDIRFTRAQEVYGARRIFVHERFVSSTFENDVAIIRLDRPVTFTERVASICLPTNNLTPGLQVTVAGWGTVAETSRVHSNVLRQAHVNILPATNCRVYSDVNFDTTRQLCAAALDWSKDTW